MQGILRSIRQCTMRRQVVYPKVCNKEYKHVLCTDYKCTLLYSVQETSVYTYPQQMILTGL